MSTRILIETGFDRVVPYQGIWTTCLTEAQTLLSKWDSVVAKVLSAKGLVDYGQINVPNLECLAFGGRSAAEF